mgnify:CR=1 FL=1
MYIYYINKKGKRLSVIDFKNIYLSIFFLIILVKIETNIIIKLYNLIEFQTIKPFFIFGNRYLI